MATAKESSGLPETSAEKLAKAKQLKEEGNQLFKADQWKQAAKRYHHSLLYAKSLVDSLSGGSQLLGLLASKRNDEVTPEQKEDATKLLVTLSNNLAVCMLKMERWDNVIKHSTSVLEHQPDNVKALYRRGTAHLKLGRLDDSQIDLQKALQLDPSDSAIKKQNAALQESFKEYWKGEKQKYQGMFTAPSTGSN